MIATDKSLAHHIEIIEKVLDCFEKANIKIKAQKMSIAKPEVEFLGIVWRKGMLHIPTARISAFKNMPVPKTPKKVKSFVCAMSYYWSYLQNENPKWKRGDEDFPVEQRYGTN